MARYYLSEISIEGFRGINNDGDPLIIKFKSDAVNSIHAHNGVGKTSIFEAIHFAIYGTIPRLTTLQRAEHPEAYVVNRFHPAGEATIGFHFEADDGSAPIEISVKRDALGTRTVTSATGHDDPEGFLRSLREDFVLVDYSRFAKFVDASALERGRSFASLVGLSSYSTFRQALESASDTRAFNNDFDIRVLEAAVVARQREIAEAAARALTAHTEITGQAAAELSDVVPLCASVTGAVQSVEMLKPIVGTNDIRRVDIGAAEKLVEKEEGGPLRARYADLLKAIADLKILVPAETEPVERNTILRLASERDSAMAEVGSLALRELYERASAVVDDAAWTDPNQCPVCDTKLGMRIADHLRARIAQYSAADEANVNLAAAVDAADSIAQTRKVGIRSAALSSSC